MLAVLVLSACGGTATEEKPAVDETPQTEVVEDVEETQEDAADEESLYPLTVNDAVGNDIVIEAAPTTIISMMPSNTEILYALGLADEVVAVTDNDNYPEEVDEKESIGGFEFNVEKIISLNPEMVLAHEMAMGVEDGLQQIRDAGIPVIVIPNAENFDETYETIETIGQVNDKVAEAAQIIEEMKAKVEEVVSKTATAEEEKTVFVETSDAPEIYTPGNNTFVQEMLDMIGAKNIVEEDDWIMIDPEEIVDKNPDVIVVMYDYVPDIVESIKNRDGFADVTAVKEDAVVQVDEDLTSRVGPRLAEGLEEFAQAIYPEVFSE